MFQMPTFILGNPFYSLEIIIPVVMEILKEQGFQCFLVTPTTLFVDWKTPKERAET